MLTTISIPSLSTGPSLRTGMLISVVGAALISLGGCVSAPTGDPRQLLASVPAAALEPAEAAANSGDAAAAAAAYLDLAKQSQAPARQVLELRAAEAYYLAGQTQQALRTISSIKSDRLNSAARASKRLLGARIALQAALPQRALAELNGLGQAGTKLERLGLKAAAYRQSGDPVQAANILTQIDPMLSGASQRLDNQVSILMTLSMLNTAELRQAAKRERGRVRGWAALAELLAQHDSASAVSASFAQWRASHGGLRASDRLPQAYFAALAGDYAPGAKTWVLLPQGGRYGAASAAIQGGIRGTDQLNTSGNRPQLKTADSAANPAGAYQAARAAGADVVIGPLQKQSVDRLTEQQNPSVSTLALNRNANGRSLPTGFYEFALTPEDEASSAANIAWASGFRSALILAPQGPWGNRMAGALRAHWQALGGKRVGEVVYGTTEASMTSSIESLLAPGEGDLIFLLATNPDAKMMWERLQGANSRNLPVIATSHVYSGAKTDGAALNGLYFVDVPWLLDADLPAAAARLHRGNQSQSAPLLRLQAMGVDSYRLAPRTAKMGNHPGHFFFGASGGLSIDGSGRVQRELVLARLGATGPEMVSRIQAAPGKKTR